MVDINRGMFFKAIVRFIVLNATVCPLKLYDFLAIGMPIVTTDFPTVKEFKNVVRVADSK